MTPPVTRAHREAQLLELHTGLCEEYGLEEKGERAPILEALNVAYNLGGEHRGRTEAEEGGKGFSKLLAACVALVRSLPLDRAWSEPEYALSAALSNYLQTLAVPPPQGGL